MDVRNPLKAGREQPPDLVSTFGATSPGVGTTRKVEYGMVAEEGHDAVQVVSVEGFEKCLEHVDTDHAR
jgi:hypothetical protein